MTKLLEPDIEQMEIELLKAKWLDNLYKSNKK